MALLLQGPAPWSIVGSPPVRLEGRTPTRWSLFAGHTQGQVPPVSFGARGEPRLILGTFVVRKGPRAGRNNELGRHEPFLAAASELLSHARCASREAAMTKRQSLVS